MAITILPNPPQLFENSSQKDWLFLLYLRIQEDLKQQEYEGWIPVVSGTGSMSIANLVINKATWAPIGTHVFFEMDITFDTTGTSANQITFTLPLDALNKTVVMGAISESGTFVSSNGITIAGSKTVSATLFNGFNFTITTGINLVMSGTYTSNESY